MSLLKTVLNTMTTTTINSKKPIIIVGAGAAGLQAAYSLMELGHDDIVILEARNRVGGRIHTLRRSDEHDNSNTTARTTIRGDNDDDDSSAKATFMHHARFPEYMDLGAAWVHGTDPYPVPNPMLNYIRPSNLREIAPGNPWMRPQTVMHMGRRGEQEYVVDPQQKTLINLFYQGKRLGDDQAVVDQALSRHFYILKDCVPRKVRELYESGRGLETALLSLQDTINDVKKNIPADNFADDRVNILVRFYQHLIPTWYGKSPAHLQLANFTAEEDEETTTTTSSSEEKSETLSPAPPDWTYEEEGDFRGPHCVVKGGMATLLEPLLEKVRDKVLLEKHVKEILLEEDTVVVRTQSGETYEGPACIVTLPVNCLREDLLTLFPQNQISNEKKEALQYVSMGGYKKVMIVFDRIFWPVGVPFLGLMRDTVLPHSGIGDCLLIDNLWADEDGLACLEAILVGDAASWATGRSDIEIRDAVLDFMEDSLQVQEGQLYHWCVDCHVTRWEEDPYTRGAYTSLSLGALPRHVDALNLPEWNGALVFAGEAIVGDFEGGVHAALFSGMAAATHIHQFVSGDDSKEKIPGIQNLLATS